MSTERDADLEWQYYGKKEDIRRLEEDLQKIEANIYIPEEQTKRPNPVRTESHFGS